MRYSAILMPLLIIQNSANVNADLVLKDHVTDSSNWDGLPLITHEFPVSLPAGAAGAASAFVGNGQVLKTVLGIYAHESFQGVPNAGTPERLAFRFAFHSTTDSYISDPFLTNAVSPNVFHRIDAVSNQSDWLDVLGVSDSGHNLFKWEFDVQEFGIQTVQGQVHLVSVIPETDGISGPTLFAFSNGTNATGSLPDWFRSNALGPDELSDLNAPHFNAAYRVTTIPEPSSFRGILPIICFLIFRYVVKRIGNCCQIPTLGSRSNRVFALNVNSCVSFCTCPAAEHNLSADASPVFTRAPIANTLIRATRIAYSTSAAPD